MAIKVDGKPLTRGCDLFGDSVTLMKSLGQTTREWNDQQLRLYLKLMCEELGETIAAAFPGSAWRRRR